MKPKDINCSAALSENFCVRLWYSKLFNPTL